MLTITANNTLWDAIRGVARDHGLLLYESAGPEVRIFMIKGTPEALRRAYNDYKIRESHVNGSNGVNAVLGFGT